MVCKEREGYFWLYETFKAAFKNGISQRRRERFFK